MKRVPFGRLGEVSRLTIGGGGIGQVWGPTSREEGVATLRMAIDAGIDLIDAAPGYNVCEALIGEAFEGRLPYGVRVTTKHWLGSPAPGEVYPRLRASLDKSLADMRLKRADIFFLHNPLERFQAKWEPVRRPETRQDINLEHLSDSEKSENAPVPDDHRYRVENERRHELSTTWSLYRDHVVPAFERLVQEGLIGAWGITGVAVPDTIVAAIEAAPRPQAVQAVANLLDSPGGLVNRGESYPRRDIAGAAVRNGVAVMAIRAVQAGALTQNFDRDVPEDHPDMADYRRAEPFRALCERWGENPAYIAHRYALGMPGVETLVLGVKNRKELAEALRAEQFGPLEPERVEAIDALALRRSTPAPA